MPIWYKSGIQQSVATSSTEAEVNAMFKEIYLCTTLS
jgi:hypothetical protein